MHFVKETGALPGGNRFYLYRPPEPPRAVLQVCHGMCEYVERYEPLADWLAQRGVLMCGADHAGHGRTATRPEDLGYFPGGWQRLARDAYDLTAAVKREYPRLPFFLLGHSMGSFVARDYLRRYGRELDGAILCGTSGGNPWAGLGIALAKAIAAAKGERHRSALLNRLAFSGYNSRYGGARTAFDWLTRDRAVVDAYIADPLCNFVFTAQGFETLFRLLRSVSGAGWYRSVPEELPVLLIAGDMDPVGGYGKGVAKVGRRLKRAGVRDVSCTLYPGARHELFNETNAEAVCQDILRWLETCPTEERT